MLATDKQVKYFFALIREIGEDAVEYKERAKASYGLNSFNDITSDQINTLIFKIKDYALRKGVELKTVEEVELEHTIPPHSPEAIAAPKKDDGWDNTPERVKTAEEFTKKDWREVVAKFTEACEHDWVEMNSEFNKYHASKCIKCPAVRLEVYQREAFEMTINYKPVQKSEEKAVEQTRDFEDSMRNEEDY